MEVEPFEIERIEVKARSRTLKARWTFEIPLEHRRGPYPKWLFKILKRVVQSLPFGWEYPVGRTLRLPLYMEEEEPVEMTNDQVNDAIDQILRKYDGS